MYVCVYVCVYVCMYVCMYSPRIFSLIIRRITSVYHITLQLPLSSYLLFANYSLSPDFFVFRCSC